MAGFKCVTILFMVPIYMPSAHIATDFLARTTQCSGYVFGVYDFASAR